MEGKKILIIHTPGNYADNPTLDGLFKILLNNHYSIDYLVHSACRKNVKPTDSLNVIYYKLYNKPQLSDCYSLILGVDEDIRFAKLIAYFYKCKYALISFEITFLKEVGLLNKLFDQWASRHIDFAICQDRVRSSLLSEENKIDSNKIFNIPVAPLRHTKYNRNKTTYLYDLLNIEKNKKIALFMGAVSPYNYLEQILKSVKKWPQEWVFVVNSRRLIENISDEYKTENTYWSTKPIENIDDLHLLTDSADIGIALYNYKEGNACTGRNFKYIGLASGKIATYLSFGLPVLTNTPVTEYARVIKKYNMGLVVDNVDNIPIILSEFDTNQALTDNCINFYENELNLKNYEERLIDKITNISYNSNRNVNHVIMGLAFKVILFVSLVLKKIYYKERAF